MKSGHLYVVSARRSRLRLAKTPDSGWRFAMLVWMEVDMKTNKVMETKYGSRIEKVEHDWDKQCAWVCQDGSHCRQAKSAGSDLCESHRIVAG